MRCGSPATAKPTWVRSLFVNKSAVDTEKNELHARLTWGAAQAGVAAGVMAAAEKRVLRADELETARGRRMTATA